MITTTPTPTPTPTIEKGSDDDCPTGSSDRYDGIAEELRFLSDLHRMKERNSNGNGNGNSNSNSNRYKSSGRTRTLKARHADDFNDEDYTNTNTNNNDDSNNAAHTTTTKTNRVSDRRQYNDNNNRNYRRFRLFNKFSRSVCKIQAIARKEIFEAWAMALYVHECFFTNVGDGTKQHRHPIAVKRFADLACSHGLLSWALLLLSSYNNDGDDCGNDHDDDVDHDEPVVKKQEQQQQKLLQPNAKGQRPLTAVCIDISMPKSSETAAKIFFEDYPQFCDDGSSSSSSSSDLKHGHHPCWDYIEGPIESIVPDPSTLLMGIHACGRLSDTVIDLAIRSMCPLALVPCCHSKKILTPDQASDFAALMTSNASSTSSCSPILPSYTLADFMDAHRKQRLIDAGYAVREVMIPEEFTPKNRILLAVPPMPLPSDDTTQDENLVASTTTTMQSTIAAKIKQLQRNWGIPRVDIPVADTPAARAVVRSISGRKAANRRKEEANPPPSICLSVWLSPLKSDNDSNKKEKEEPFTVEALQRVIDNEIGTSSGANGNGNENSSSSSSSSSNDNNGSGRLVRVENQNHKPFYNKTDGRLSLTYRIHYLDCKNNKAEAKERHRILKKVTIPRYFPSVVLRD